VNTLLLWLQAICFFLARQPDRSFTAEALFNAVGRFDAPLSAFVGGDKADPSTRGLAEEPVLSGWRCLHCGYDQVSRRNVDTFIADDILPDMVFHACEACMLNQLVDQVLAVDLADITDRRDQIAQALRHSNISLSDSRSGCAPARAVEATTPRSIAGNVPQSGKLNLNPQTIIYRLRFWGNQYTGLLLAR